MCPSTSAQEVLINNTICNHCLSSNADRRGGGSRSRGGGGWGGCGGGGVTLSQGALLCVWHIKGLFGPISTQLSQGQTSVRRGAHNASQRSGLHKSLWRAGLVWFIQFPEISLLVVIVT